MLLKLSATLAVLFALAGCGSAPTAQRYDQIMAGKPKKIEIEILGSVAQQCHLDPTYTYFAYNDGGLDEHGIAVLREVAECMKSGPMLGRSVLVSGYTDITGTRRYNQELGMTRGEAVALELMKHGVCPERIYVRSRGEKYAHADPDLMASDRRVELMLVQRE
jgi:outer membrane protein OmpA-like peptidoglycan-associated protein